MKSLPTIDIENQKKYLGALSVLDPDLYLIRMMLLETGVNPKILPKFIRAVSNLAYGTGFGKIQVFMSDRTITSIKPEENDLLNIPATEEDR